MARTANLPPASPTPRFQVRHLIAGFSAVFGLACLVTLGALFNIATTLDQQERQRSAFHGTQAGATAAGLTPVSVQLCRTGCGLRAPGGECRLEVGLRGKEHRRVAVQRQRLRRCVRGGKRPHHLCLVQRTTQPGRRQHLYRCAAAADHRPGRARRHSPRADNPFRAVQWLAGRTRSPQPYARTATSPTAR